MFTSVRDLRTILERAWSAETSADAEGWSPKNPAWGQCAVTALLVQELYGGSLLRTKVGNISHYWNLLPSGEEVDLTRDQFNEPGLQLSGQLRSREYVLSFPDTVRRYERLRRRLEVGVRATPGPGDNRGARR
jgi:hypothetical protein